MANSSDNENTSCLIGYTGFVGQALCRQTSFSALYNTQNISQLDRQEFQTVVCAAAPGSMFEANRQPDQDREKVHALIDHLATVRADRFVLISSIAVLAGFAGGDDEGTKAFQHDLAYGRHRRELEAFVEQRFTNSLIIRLPALFGEGLRKNFIFDLLNPVPTMLSADKLQQLQSALDAPLAVSLDELYTHDDTTGLFSLDRTALNRDRRRSALEQAVTDLGFSATQFHHRDTTYQYYPIDRLWADIGVATNAGLSHIHLVTEPVKASTIHQRLTGSEMPETAARVHHEDMRTRHAAQWDISGPYLADADTTLERLSQFSAAQRVPA